MANAKFESWFPFSQSGLDLEEFIVEVIILVLLSFCVKEFIDFRFQISIWNPDLTAESVLLFPLTPICFGILHLRISLLFHIESSLLNSRMICGCSSAFF